MQPYSLEFDHLSVIFSIIVRVMAGMTLLFFVIPLQTREAGVKNGLRTLRKQLLVSGITIFIINTFGLLIYIMRMIVDDGMFRFLTNSLAIVNSLGFATMAFIKYQIYHQNYTPEQKKKHEIISEIEKGNLKVVKKGGAK